MRWHPTYEELVQSGMIEISGMAGLTVLPIGGEGNTNQGPFAKTGCEDGGIPPQPSPPTKKTELEKLTQIWEALKACDETFRVLGKEWTEYKGVPIKFWIEDAKECFTS